MIEGVSDTQRTGGGFLKKEWAAFVFIVVVYRNVKDVIELLDSMKENVSEYKTIIVNNYYDNETKKQFQRISQDYGCDFLNCENRGYGAGNNSGIRFALEKYEFDYLVISNPDIVIKKFPEEDIRQYPEGVLGCKIYNLAKKNQNPMLPKDNRFSARMIYGGLRKNSGICLFAGKAVNRIQREVLRVVLSKKDKRKRKVYQVHGSFVIFSKGAIKEIGEPYDEEMFLFGEEAYLAYMLKQKGVKTFYCPEAEVLHKEDGSMKFRDDVNKECVKAVCYFFERYYFNPRKGGRWKD